MKLKQTSILSICLLLLLAFNAFAQDPQTKPNEQDLSLEHLKGNWNADADEPSTAAESDFKPEKSVLVFHYDALQNAPSGVGLEGFNRGFTSNNFLTKRIANTRFGAAIGYGLSNRNYYGKVKTWATNPITLYADSLYKKGRLSITTLNVPLELRYISLPNAKKQSFRASIGFCLAYVLSSSTKFIDNTESLTIQRRTVDLKALNRFRYGVSARASYHRFGVEGYYGLNKWFKSGTDVSPLSIGISFSGL